MTRIGSKWLGVAMAMMIVGATVGAWAQVANRVGDAAAPSMETAKTSVRLRPAMMTDIPLNDPRLVDLGSLAAEGISPKLTEGVTVKAYTRYVEFEGKKIGQMMLVAVEKDGRRETLAPESFAAQFDIKTEAKLEPGKEVTVQGDRTALADALQRLQQQATPAKKDEKPQEVKVDAAKAQQSNSSPEKRNEQAAAWQTPSPLPVTQEAKEAVQVRKDGCPVRIDTAGMRAIQQSRTETTKGGAVTGSSECSDDLSEVYPLQKGYSVCTDQVDLTARSARAQYKLYYVDAGGARLDVSDCAPDTEKTFPIVEKASVCTIFLDYNQHQAVPQSALVYVNANGVETQVRGCQASETKPAATMTQVTNLCSMRHDYSGGKSVQQATWVYLLDGVQYQAGSCSDTETVYAHEKVYKDASGTYICAPVINIPNSSAVLQSRVRITVDGNGQYLTECKPDTSSLAVVRTTDTCTDPGKWTHDLAAGVSYGQERFYFMDGGQRQYVTNCQNGATVYTHQVEITDWENHDDQLYAYSKSTVYIVPPTGRYNIVAGEVLVGAQQMAYELQGTSDVANGQSEYAGCSALRLTDRVQVWKRPNTTMYNIQIGTGTPTGPVDVCLSTTIAANQFQTGEGAEGAASGGGGCSYWGDTGQGLGWILGRPKYLFSGTVNKNQKKNVENGAIIGTSCAFATVWNAVSTQQGCVYGDAQPNTKYQLATNVEAGICPAGF